MSELPPELVRAARLRREGRLAEALALLDDVARRHPDLPQARALRGHTLCNLERFDEGLAEMAAAVALAPRDANLHCDLGFLLFVADRLADARASLEQALALQAEHPDALVNLSLVARAQGRFAQAEEAARRALAARPSMYQAHINLAYALLVQGKFAEAWPHHSHRPAPHVNLRDPHLAAGVPHAEALPPAPSPLVIHGEQGLGDSLFFLRFAPALRERGYRLAFWGDTRLHRLLAAAGIFEHCIAPESTPAEGIPVLWAGDLPRLLGANDPAGFPAPLPLAVDRTRHEALRRHLASLGPPPYVGVTWRAGLPRAGRIVLSKMIAPEALGKAIAGARGTFLSLQRSPRPEELAELAAALGTRVHDAASANERLEDAFALVAALDEYVAVSNTNVHLRASAGLPARVLVPWPPEWRWPEKAPRSPWFPAMPLYRQAADGGWEAALARLAADVHGGGGARAMR